MNGISWPFSARAQILLRSLSVSSSPPVLFLLIGSRGVRMVDIEGILEEVVVKVMGTCRVKTRFGSFQWTGIVSRADWL
jgi:hypothetical protein